VKLFSSTPRAAPGASNAPPTGRDVQAAPLALAPGDASGARLKADAAYRFGNAVIVAGWCSGRQELGLACGGVPLDVQRVAVARPDVAAHLQLPGGGEQLGFVIVATAADEDAPVVLTWEAERGTAAGTSAPLQCVKEAPAGGADTGVLGPALGLLALSHAPHSEAWLALIGRAPPSAAACRSARGFLEGGAACELTRDAVVVGWVVHNAGTVVWLEDDSGRTWPIDGYRRFRQDVHDAVGNDFGHASRDAGFVVRLRGVRPGSTVRLKAVAETGVHVLSATTCSTLPLDPVAAARWLFAVATPAAEMHRRVPMVDEPVLGPLIAHRQAVWDELPVQRRQLGNAPAAPDVAVIVPLYGRSDFVEHQLIEFADDPWLRAHAEIVYVIDDPKLVDTFPGQAEALHRLYRVPFRWVWGSVNRGFSGANNLGVKHSQAPVLVFLNSDAFPQQPGWVQALADVLAARPEIGAVGPRLVFADGAIQHAGMEFQRREELGVWVNHHPRMGLDPALDPHATLAVVPAVTGACLAVRRADLEAVGGWDTGYLVGDFEDSDLCLKLRNAGLQAAYLPDVQLTHLERQSFKLLGQDEFRQRVVIYNAVRHQTRWVALIEAGAAPAATPQP
jgi:GT2 family glycosyltransferase